MERGGQKVGKRERWGGGEKVYIYLYLSIYIYINIDIAREREGRMEDKERVEEGIHGRRGGQKD